MQTNIIAELKERDRCLKAPNQDVESILLHRLYTDQARGDVIAQLRTMGLGLKDAQWPLVVGMLQRVVSRLAVVYQNPATRWLRRNDQRLSETDKEHKNAMRIYKRAQVDLAMQDADALRALHRQVALRVYPNDARKSVVLRTFAPFNILRMADPSNADDFASDEAFALCLDAQAGGKETWEVWTHRDDGSWICVWLDQSGSLIRQPFASSSDVSPYGSAPPVTMLYDAPPMGAAYLPPRSSRLGFTYIISSLANDLLSLAANQAHSRQVLTRDKLATPNAAPLESAHGAIIELNTTESFQIVTPQPQIAAVDALMKTFCQLFMMGEALPVSELDDSKNILTGPALQVLERPLQARREKLTALADEDERMLYERFRSVHNIHASGWGQPTLALDTELEVEVADPKTPTDPAVLQKVGFADIAAGLSSSIDYIQARDSVPRHVAIETWQRVQDDRKMYPADTIIVQQGQKLAGIDNQVASELKDLNSEEEQLPTETLADVSGAPGVAGAAELMGQPSVIDALKN